MKASSPIPPPWSEWRTLTPDYYEFWPAMRRNWDRANWIARVVFPLASVLGIAGALVGFPDLLLFVPLFPLQIKRPWESGDWSLPEDGDGVAVYTSYRVGHFTYGVDRGRLILVDGWMIFEGCESCFAVKADDFSRISTQDRRWPVRPNQVRTYEGGATLQSGPLEIDLRPMELRNWDGFMGAVFDWAAAPSAAGRSVFPPTAPHPIRASESVRLWIYGLFLLFTAIGFVVSWHRWGPGNHQLVTGGKAAVAGVTIFVFMLMDARPGLDRQLARVRRQLLSSTAGSSLAIGMRSLDERLASDHLESHSG